MASRKRSNTNETDICDQHKEWDEASCPICMDHPHNAVLLLCTSHEKGCRSYICDTSYRHSNCLDRFAKLRAENRNIPSLPSYLPRHEHDTSHMNLVSRSTSGNNIQSEGNTMASVELARGLVETSVEDADGHLEVQGEGILETGGSETFLQRTTLDENSEESSQELESSLRCPLCRGAVLGWKVVEEARKYLNLKPRSCSYESCSFSGNYRELRQHARRTHPTARPADIDPSRERAWRRLERHREYTDIVSAVRSAMPGAIVLGDYVVETGNRVLADRERTSGEVNRPWWTTLFLFQMIGSTNSVTDLRRRSRAWARHRRTAGAFSRRRFLWGENLLGLQDDENVDDEPFVDILSDSGDDGSPTPRRRRRLTQSRSDEDQ